MGLETASKCGRLWSKVLEILILLKDQTRDEPWLHCGSRLTIKSETLLNSHGHDHVFKVGVIRDGEQGGAVAI